MNKGMKTVEILNLKDFIAASERCLVVDVRAPSEYARGHIPGAVSIPLFSDEQRAAVGTAFTRQGRQQAILAGLQLIGSDMASRAEAALTLASPGSDLFVYCWRGGMRSEAMAWLFSLFDYNVYRLQGGYKAFRNAVQQSFLQPFDIKILAGATGSGKTEILQELHRMGQQVLDLEALASHRGSAFGGLGLEPQPGTEHFENLLWSQIRALDRSQPVWMEDESLSIGRCFIPRALFQQMQQSPAFLIEVPESDRVKRLVKMYGTTSNDLLQQALSRIARRLGGSRYQQALGALQQGHLAEVATLVLSYYDKAYNHCLLQRDSTLITRIAVNDHPQATARRLAAM